MPVQVIDWYAEGYYNGWAGLPRGARQFDLDELDAAAYARGYQAGEAAALGSCGHCEFCSRGPACSVCKRGGTCREPPASAG
jgi:hypothetical protein